MNSYRLAFRAIFLLTLLLLVSRQPGHTEELPPAAAANETQGESANSPGEEAVKRVKNLGFRLSSKSAPDSRPQGEAKGAPTDPASDASTPSGEAPLYLGRVKEQASLPPELAELGKEGALAVAAENWEEAREIYLKMLKAAPDNALAYANLGVVEFELGNLLAAAGNLNRSTELNPHIARNWQTLGLIHYERGDLTLALSCLARAVHEEPSEAETRLILAAVVRDYGWDEAAVTELQRAVEINPRLAAAHYNLAVTYLGQTPPRLELARRHYYAAIDLGTAPSPEIEAVLNQDE